MFGCPDLHYCYLEHALDYVEPKVQQGGSVVIKQINMTFFIIHNRNRTITFAVMLKPFVFLVT